MSTRAQSRIRRTSLVTTVMALGLMSAVPAAQVAQAASRHPARGDGCPAAESLVPGTTWHRHTLAPGVVMSAGSKEDSRGLVAMHILRVNLAQKGLALKPLVHSLAERSPLSALAGGHPNMVAATNTGYFDFRTGAPTQPLISGRVPLVISSAHQEVVGLTASGLMESGKVWWSALLTAGKRTHSVVDKNELDPPSGLSIYTPKWGSTPVSGRWGSTVRAVAGGVVTSASSGGRSGPSIPSNGYLIVAHGQSATNWLNNLSVGTKVSLASSVVTSAAKPFVQAYGVGVEVVEQPGVIRSGLSCDSLGTKQPARTEVGFSDGGRTMVIAIVADDPQKSEHGLDEDQMSELMVQLKVTQAFAFDGSGSTELLARLGPSKPLTMENYPADGQERPMPVGLGIFSHPVKKKTKH